MFTYRVIIWYIRLLIDYFDVDNVHNDQSDEMVIIADQIKNFQKIESYIFIDKMIKLQFCLATKELFVCIW